MDIRSIGSLPRIYQEQLNISHNRKNKKPPSAGVSGADEVLLSSRALEFNNTLKALKNTPDLRETKVRELSEKIEAGAYHIPSAEIAESIINYSKSY